MTTGGYCAACLRSKQNCTCVQGRIDRIPKTPKEDNMKTIKATFIGANGSLGYITGKEYTLTLKELNRALWITRQDSIAGTCSYDSLMPFLENWTKIEAIN